MLLDNSRNFCFTDLMKTKILFAVAVIGLATSTFFNGVWYGASSGRDLPAPTSIVTEKEWTLPALFAGEGAFTVGCAFWNVPTVLPFSADNTDEGYVYAVIEGASKRAGIAAGLVVDGPQGTVTVIGSSCAISVDWRAFPQFQRPGN